MHLKMPNNCKVNMHRNPKRSTTVNGCLVSRANMVHCVWIGVGGCLSTLGKQHGWASRFAGGVQCAMCSLSLPSWLIRNAFKRTFYTAVFTLVRRLCITFLGPCIAYARFILCFLSSAFSETSCFLYICATFVHFSFQTMPGCIQYPLIWLTRRI